MSRRAFQQIFDRESSSASIQPRTSHPKFERWTAVCKPQTLFRSQPLRQYSKTVSRVRSADSKSKTCTYEAKTLVTRRIIFQQAQTVVARCATFEEAQGEQSLVAQSVKFALTTFFDDRKVPRNTRHGFNTNQQMGPSFSNTRNVTSLFIDDLIWQSMTILRS